MSKRIYLFAGFVLLVLLTGCQTTQESDPSSASRQESSTITGSPDLSQANEQSLSIGTAFFIKYEGTLLTNRHVVEGCKQISVFPENRTSYPATTVAISRDYDLAVLRTRGYTPEVVLPIRAHSNLRNVSIAVDGENVMTGGFSNPRDMDSLINIVDGVVAGTSATAPSSWMITYVDHGASGSPVVDNWGLLLGIVYSGIPDIKQRLPGKLEKFQSIVRFHNNNAIVDFLNKKHILFNYGRSNRRLIRMERVGLLRLVTARVVCTH